MWHVCSVFNPSGLRVNMSCAVLCCVQVADHILDNPSDKTKVSLVFANVSEGDILLKVG